MRDEATLKEWRTSFLSPDSSKISILCWTYETYEEFVIPIHKALDFIFSQLQRNPKERKEFGEDQITTEIVERLEIFSLSASFEKKVGGHCDIIVEGRNRLLWLAEAKIHGQDYSWLWQGFQQLYTRYSDGQPNSTSGGMLIYHQNMNTKLLMSRWREYITSQDEAYTFDDCPNNPLCFISKTMHQRSGLVFSVRHMPLSLHFNPKDKGPQNSDESSGKPADCPD